MSVYYEEIFNPVNDMLKVAKESTESAENQEILKSHNEN
jgi:hypothetical protein